MPSTVSRTLYHVREDELKNEFKTLFTKTILNGTHTSSSPLSKLHRTSPTILQTIFHYARPVPNEKDFYYKVGVVVCQSREYCFVEALENNNNDTDGDATEDEHYGSLANNLIEGCSWFATKDFLRKYAWTKTSDESSYLNEGQLRRLWKKFCLPRYCENPDRCKGTCAALPGDTIYWRLNEDGYPESYKYEPATQEEIEERGYLNTGPGGLLASQARLVRENPEQLFGEDGTGEDLEALSREELEFVAMFASQLQEQCGFLEGEEEEGDNDDGEKEGDKEE